MGKQPRSHRFTKRLKTLGKFVNQNTSKVKIFEKIFGKKVVRVVAEKSGQDVFP